MNQDQVTEKLLFLQKPKTPFTLIFTGKKSGKGNGLYDGSNQEILIHNKNFTNDNDLIYTAIHEYAHHLHQEQDPSIKKKTHSHINAFYAIFYNLVAIAIKKGVYQNVYDQDEDLKKITAEIREDLKALAAILKRIGKNLNAAAVICAKIGGRFEDYTSRVLQMAKDTVKLATAAFNMDAPESFGLDGTQLLASAKGQDEYQAILFALKAGKTQAEAKVARDSLRKKEQDPVEKLQNEKSRIRKTIGKLEQRLAVVETELEELDSGYPLVSADDLDMRVGA